MAGVGSKDHLTSIAAVSNAFGFSLCIFGIGIIHDPIFHYKKHNFIYDFKKVKLPFGVFLILFGVGFL